MHVFQVHNSYRQSGGEDTVVAEDARLLRSAGHTVTQYLVPNPTARFGAAINLGLSVWNPAAARRFRDDLQRTQPDIVHIHNTWFSLTPSVAREAKKAGLPVVMTLHNYRLSCANALFFRDGHTCTDCLTSSAMNGLRHRCYQQSTVASAFAAANVGVHRWANTWVKFVDRFLCLSEFAKARFIEAGIPAAKLHVRHNCVDDPGNRTTPLSESRQFAYVGRLAPEKGLRTLLAAWRLVGLENFELLVVGDGPEREDLEAMGIAGVRFAGSLDHVEVLTTLRSVRCLLFPSLWFEGEPMVLVEALAAGTPVVGSDVGAIPEVLGGGAAGWLADPGNTKSWVQALLSVSRSRSIAAKATASRRFYERRHTPAIGLTQLLNHYQSVSASDPRVTQRKLRIQ